MTEPYLRTVWVVTYHQTGEGPSSVESVHESEGGALQFMDDFTAGYAPGRWSSLDRLYRSDSLTGNTLVAHESKVQP